MSSSSTETRRTRESRRGFTLLECAISLVILIVLMVVVGQVVLAGSRAFREGSTQEALAMKTRRALDRIADELEMAGLSTLTPAPVAPFGSSTLSLRQPTGLVNNVVQFGNTTRIALAADPGDAANGADDDQDGLVDESVVQLTKDVGLASQRTVVLADDACRFLEGETGNGADDNANGLVDEGGLSFLVQGSELTVRLSLQGLDPNRQRITSTARVSIRIRN